MHINGADIHYEVAGDGAPVVFIHSGITDGRMWDPHFSHFASFFRGIRYDMRGYGRSSLPPGPSSHMEDLEVFLNSLGVDTTAIVGASFGGAIAIEFAISFPDRVDALVLAASALGGHEWSTEVTRYSDAEDEALEAGDIEKAVELNLRMWVDGYSRGSEVVDSEMRKFVGDMQRRAFEVWLDAEAKEESPGPESRLDPPANQRLEEITAPTLILVGDRDVADLNTIADVLETNIPTAQKVVVSDAAHLINLEQPNEFVNQVLPFLTTHSQRLT
jgi:3-oxoadipate enol-lactonase